MNKPLHERKISELEKCADSENGDDAIMTNALREWAIACVKEYKSKMGCDIEIHINPKVELNERVSFSVNREITSPETSHMCVITFLIDAFELTEEELK